MFLIAFVTLIVSIIGLFTEVYGLQTAKINAAQSALTQTMITWHGTVTTYVQSLYSTTGIDNPPVLATPSVCMLTPLAASALISTGINACTYTNPGNPPPSLTSYLPPGYNLNGFPFYSVVYIAANSTIPYVLTYVDPNSKDANGNLILPALSNGGGSVTIGFTINDVMREFANITTNYLSYGSVTQINGQQTLTLLGASNGAAGAGLKFAVPAQIPTGAVAIISLAN